ncbi:MAG: Cu(I)-responsive transcriptional regulator [Alphaproteobacteria bacterium]
MNIGEAAARSGLPAKTIRYYESRGLLTPASRRPNAYRDYDGRDVHTLRFLARARRLGFSVEDCRALLSLYQDRARSSSDVKRVAEQHLKEMEHRIAELTSLRDALAVMVRRCHGDERPDCPILDGLAGDRGEEAVSEAVS